MTRDQQARNLGLMSLWLKTLDGLAKLAHAVANLGGRTRALCAFGLGAVQTLALAPLHFLPAMVISFTGLVWLLDGAARVERPLRAALWIGWWFGFGYHLFGLYWIGFAFLVDAAAFAWMIPFAVTLMPAGLALFTSLAAALALKMWTQDGTRVLALVFAWGLTEWLRGHVLTGFPWNLAAYVWAGHLSVAQSASVLGAYGLTLVTVAAGACLAALVPMRSAKPSLTKWDWGLPLGALVLISALSVGGSVRLAGDQRAVVPGVTLRLVQPSVPQKEKWKPENRTDILATYLAMSAAPPADPTSAEITLLIWPESALPTYLNAHPEVLAAIADMLGSEQHLLTGAARYEFGPDGKPRFYNSAHLISPAGEIIATYDKYHLVPFGEYLPLEPLLSGLGLKKLTAGAGGFTAGPGPQAMVVPGAGAMMPLICYEAIFPGRMPQGIRPAWLLNVTNDAWYGNTSGPRQHLAQSQFRAIEQGLPFIRSANTGISAIIDGHGTKWSRIDLNQKGVLDSPLPLALAPTLYSRFGDFIFWNLLIAIALLALVRARLGSYPA